MKKKRILIKLFFICTTILSTTTCLFSQGQSSNCILLSQKEISDIFNDSLKREYNLENAVLKIYKYSDKSGNYLTILNEIKGPYILLNNDTPNIKANAINLKNESGKISKIWNLEKDALPDYIVGVQDINFLEAYIEFNDLDNDSIIDPIIVYKTLTEIGLSVIYKNNIIPIEYQFKGVDFKSLRIDKSFYELPQIIKSYIEHKLYSMKTSMNIELPKAWQKKMKKNKTLIRAKKYNR